MEGLTREDLDAKEQEWQQELEGARMALFRVDGALAAIKLLKELLEEKEKKAGAD